MTSRGEAVIVTDSGGPAEYVEDGVTGFLIPAGDTNALAARIEALLSNPPLAARLGQAARERAGVATIIRG
jgi:glycosyltransferase involved in cell wall biosynthesis